MPPQLKQGQTLQSVSTGMRYRVEAVEGPKVHVSGLPPISRAALQKDINDGKIKVL